MSDVVDLEAERQARRLIWVCLCGCLAHRVYADGQIECADCGAPGHGGPTSWRQQLPAEPAQPQPVDPTSYSVLAIDRASTFLRRRAAADDVEHVMYAALVYRDGSMATYGQREVADCPDWLWSKLAQAVQRSMRHFRRGEA